MQIELSSEVTEKLKKELEPFGLSEDSLRWGRKFSINLSKITKAKATHLRDILEKAGKTKGAQARVADVNRWLEILEGKSVRCKRISDFAPMLKTYLKTAPKHWIYTTRENSDVYQPYYVDNIHYEPPSSRGGDYSPAYVKVKYYWEELGKVHSDNVYFHADDVGDLTVEKALALKDFVIERPDMLETYNKNLQKYRLIHDKVGRQFIASGLSEKEDDEDRYWYRKVKVHMGNDGTSRVVVDVLNEGDEREGKGETRPEGEFWEMEGCDFEGDEDDDDDDIKPGDEDVVEQTHAIIPLAPSLMCFDLKRHCRLKIYVDQLTEYKYQTDLGSKLVLPEEITGLVDMLIHHKGGFKDIIGNKGAGAVVLCAGPPGTGKTLTSEIYSEAEQRPLYSVQCSQLGTNPDALEKELMKVFARAQRWNAILLLDEADVYVCHRGSDLKQNAIVGVFLRVLEYYGGVMFMTTNRADLVDDAIASRCLARINYEVPTPDNQRKIWRILADTSGIHLPNDEIDLIVEEFPSLSGRDVKNLLKLGSLVTAATGTSISVDTIRYVKRFKPTGDPSELSNGHSVHKRNKRRRNPAGRR